VSKKTQPRAAAIGPKKAFSEGSKLSSLASMATLLASVVAMAVSAYTLVYLIRPSLKPPETLGASLSKVEVERNITFGEYLKRIESAGPNNAPAPDSAGNIVLLKVAIQGVQQRGYFARLAWVNVDTQEVRPTNSDCPQFSPSAPTHGIVMTCWVSSPSKGSYRLKAELLDVGPATLVPSRVNPDILDMLDFAYSRKLTYPN
jgi:hypothetical protein